MSYGIEIWKNLSQNLIQRGTTNIYSLVKDAGLNNCTISQDTIAGPISGLASNPLKLTVTGTDAYIISYNAPQWSIANAQQNETFTLSVWVKADRATTIQLFIFGADSNGECFTSPDFNAGAINIGTSWTRAHFAYTMTKSTTKFVQLRLDGPDSGAYGTTIWWDCVQLERGVAVPTSFNSRASEKILVNDMLGGRVFLGLMDSATVTSTDFTDVPTAADIQVYTLRYGYSSYSITQPTGTYPRVSFVGSGGNSSAGIDFWRSTILAVFATKVSEPDYGLSVVNASGQRLTSTKYTVPVFIGEVPINGTPSLSNSMSKLHVGQASLGSTNSEKLILWALPETDASVYYSGNCYIQPTTTNQVVAELNVYTTLANYPLPRAYVFQLNNIGLLSSEHNNYGLQLFNSSSQKTFDSGLSHMAVAGILTNVNFTTTEQSKSLPTNLIGAPLITFPQYARQSVFKNTYTYREGAIIYTDYEDYPNAITYKGAIRYKDGLLYYMDKRFNVDSTVNFAIGEYYYSNSSTNYIMVVDGNTYAANVGIASGAAFTATINKDSGTNTCAYDTRFANVCENQEQYSIILNGSNGNPIIYSWQIINPSSGGNFSFSLSSQVLTSAGNPVVLYNSASAGIETCTLKCTISQSGNPTLEVSLNIARTHNQQTATAILTPSKSSYNEGETVSITVETTAVPNSTTLYVVPDTGNTVNWGPVDFDDQTTNFWVNISNNQGTINRTLKQDATTEGTEKLKLKLVTAANGTNQVGTSSPEITINDTSVTPLGVPVANFTLNPTSGTVPPNLPVTVTDTSTGTITSRTWKVISPASTTTNYGSTTPQISLSSVGTWTYELTVTNSSGSNTIQKSVVVSAASTTPQISSVVVNPNPTNAGNSYTITVTMNRAVTADTSLDVTITNGVLSDGSTGTVVLANLLKVLAGQTTVTFNGKLGPDYGTRTCTLKVGKATLSISDYSITWNFASLAPSIPAKLISDSSLTSAATTITSGNHLVNNVYWYYFVVSSPTLAVGTSVPRTIETREINYSNDTKIGLYDGNGVVIQVDDDSNGNRHSKITRNDFKVGSSYWVGVAKYAATQSFSAKWVANSPDGAITPDDSSIIVYV
jgi:hypothetical protein